ncbi:hypothetical protein ALC60_06136 [Trachymyrmex zeteki]|uniref:Uncharacterized protein n=1 Tax=Mycetomoellerius zeteki TaxID=64791 RepID=A0A151X3I2_9HYME|nr:hypothetical protein ALC60_06136 [Trachymyrmex zeteki]
MQIGTRYDRITSGHDSLFLPSASLSSRLLLVDFTIFRQCYRYLFVRTLTIHFFLFGESSCLSLGEISPNGDKVKLGCGDGEGVTGWEYEAVSYMNAQHSNVLTTKSSRGANGSLPYVLQDCVLP